MGVEAAGQSGDRTGDRKQRDLDLYGLPSKTREGSSSSRIAVIARP